MCDELKRCPWCGSIPEIDYIQLHIDRFCLYIGCVNRECSMKPRALSDNEFLNMEETVCMYAAFNDPNEQGKKLKREIEDSVSKRLAKHIPDLKKRWNTRKEDNDGR